jgi:hypothetical protein
MPNFNSRDFLRNRLEDLGSSVSEWNEIIDQKNILVILDGMDEMTRSLTPDAVRAAIDLLTDCCNREFGRINKIIITCRSPFFEELTQRSYVEEKLGNPRIIYIDRFDKRQVYQKLEEFAVTSEQKMKLHALKQMHDPIGLAGKALFFKMVSENLATAEGDYSRETAVYQTYIDNCLSAGRKMELLEPNRQHTVEADLKEGLLEIMEHIAIEIHLSAKDYVYLKSVKGVSGGKSQGPSTYARVLWKSIEDEQVEEDALHRIGVRSLLHKKSQGINAEDKGAWPVEFCHRSVREYFVARVIEKALRKGVGEALKVLERVDYNHEILRFTAELMKKSGHDYKRTLRDLACMSRIDGDRQACHEEERQCRARLGRTSVTLLFKWLGNLPENDWSNLTLDTGWRPTFWGEFVEKGFP